ncbi:MAG: DNA polymerase III subunit gamma/tau [Ilumatobacteraceae bacterium]
MATQSLYRRYRPRRFSEVRGQDHVVRALRNAVAEGREGQAYLFSGPRGTGKTTSARILAKVLNCERPVGGEPCCECDSCVAVEGGTSYDVHELDAASNRGIDAMRDLIEKASLGTPGRHKVYILDEVHMLTPPAEAALLKTLEEPPDHVVFVLATTDPQKVADTIRSRTQHLQFHLIAADTLHDHVRWVADDAGLEVSEETIGQVLVRGGGSARDTLSALELVAHSGGAGAETVQAGELVEAMIDQDPGRALTMVADAVAMGREARALTEELIAHLRNGFLSLMAPELVQLPGAEGEVVEEQARRLGPPGLVRGIEVFGEALAEMRYAPDPRVLLDVAVVRLTSASASTDLAGLADRLQRLEQQVADGGGSSSPAPAPAVSPRDASTGRATLGGRAKRAVAEARRDEARPEPAADAPADIGSVEEGSPAEPAEASTTEPAADPVDTAAASEAASPASGGDVPVAGAAVVSADAWEDVVKPGLRGMARAVYAPAGFVDASAGSVTLALPNEVHRTKCEQHRTVVEAALSEHVGAAVTVDLVVGEGAPAEPAAGAASSPPAAPAEADDDIDLDALVDAPPESVKTPIDRLAEAFPGSELVDE